MKRAAQPPLSVKGHQALDQYLYALQHLKDLSVVGIRNFLSDLRETAPKEGFYLFSSEKTHGALIERAIGYLFSVGRSFI